MPRIRKPIPGVDPKLLVKDAAKLLPDPTRRLFLRGGLSLGALTLLTGCDIVDGVSAESVLRKISDVQRRRAGLAVQSQPAGADLSRERHQAAVPRSTPIIPRATSPRSTARTTSSRSAGWSRTRRPGRSNELNALPQETQITRLICVEGWSEIGKWTGVRLSEFLQARRRRPHREICLVPLRRRLSFLDRHADRAASADPDDAAVRRQGAASRNTAIPCASASRPSSASRIPST